MYHTIFSSTCTFHVKRRLPHMRFNGTCNIAYIPSFYYRNYSFEWFFFLCISFLYMNSTIANKKITYISQVCSIYRKLTSSWIPSFRSVIIMIWNDDSNSACQRLKPKKKRGRSIHKIQSFRLKKFLLHILKSGTWFLSHFYGP